MHRPTSFAIFPFTKLKTNQGVMLYYLSKYRHVLVQAPTGFGKTAVALSALLPELLNNCQIIIATRTKSQLFDIYMKWLNRFRNQHALKDITCVPLIARDDLCLASRPAETSCHNCHILKHTEQVTSKNFKRLAEFIKFSSTTLPEWQETLSDWGCPYQLIKRLCPFVDIVLTTQGYLVQRHLREKLFELTKAAIRPQSKLLLIDEIHGLAAPTIVAELPLATLKAAATIYPREPLIKFVEQCRYPGQVQRPRVRAKSVKAFLDRVKGWKQEYYQPAVALYEFLTNKGGYWANVDGQVVQLDPFPDTSLQAFKNFYKIIGMSGTLIPLKYYDQLFDVSNFRKLELPIGPERPEQPPKNFLLVSTSELKFSSAHENHHSLTYQVYAQAVRQLHGISPDHTLVACASHDMKDQLNEYLQTNYVEDPQQTVPSWLTELRTSTRQLMLAVMGGRLTEGLEILDPVTGRSKITLIIIAGLPFPIKSTLNEYLMYLYTNKYSKRLAEQHLVYLPTFVKLMQALGRGIRSPQDYAAAVLLDWRASTKFTELPRHKVYGQLDILLRDLVAFYQEKGCYEKGGRGLKTRKRERRMRT